MKSFSDVFVILALVVGFFVASLAVQYPIRNVLAQELPTFIFLRDLRFGDSGNDISMLQKVLKTDLAGSTGSPINFDNENSYFGEQTRRAVVSFQNKYVNQILLPVGLTEGTGFVGLWTRLKLNEILLKDFADTPISLSVETPTGNLNTGASATSLGVAGLDVSGLAVSASDELMLGFASRSYGSVGTSVSLSGSGFGQTSVVNFGRLKISSFDKLSQGSIEFKVPASAPTGRHEISVSVDGKTSNSVPFMVSRAGASIPKITNIEPRIARFDDEIVVIGENFSATGNTISSSLGVMDNLGSSDGQKIVFKIQKPDYLKEELVLPAWFGDKENLNWPVTIFVINENGISQDSESARFIINI